MAEEYRVPVLEVAAVLYTGDGQRYAVTLFMPPGLRLEEILEGPEPFFGAKVDGRFRLFARKALACLETAISSDDAMTDESSGLPTQEKRLRVRLRQGGELVGAVRFVPYQSVSRTVDVLNQPQRTFALYSEELVRHVVKDQVESVEED